MLITLFNYTKKPNSTSVPQNANVLYVEYGNIIEECEVLAPTIKFKEADKLLKCNYAYIKEFDRYYFIVNWIFLNENLWAAEMQVDVLATYRVPIRNQYAYVTRSASEKDERICDDKYPAKVNPVIYKSTVGDIVLLDPREPEFSYGWDDYVVRDFTKGHFVLSINGNPESTGLPTQYYILSGTGMAKLLKEIFNYNPNTTEWQGVAKGLAKEFANPIQYINKILWYPNHLEKRDPDKFYVNINCGYYTFNNINGYATDPMSISNIENFTSFKITESGINPEYARVEPYRYYQLQFNPFGTFNLDSSMLLNSQYVTFTWYNDIVTGDSFYRIINDDNDIIEQGYARTGTEIPITQTTTDSIGAMGGIVGSIGNLVTGNFTGLASSIGNAANAMKPKATSKGSNGSVLSWAKAIKPYLQIIEYRSIERDNTNFGSPLCSYRILGTLPGFCQCEVNNVEIPNAYSSEVLKIMEYLNKGVFIE